MQTVRVPRVGSLTAVGLTEIAEDVYRVLLAQPGATADELCTYLSASTASVESGLTALTREGLVDRSLETPTRYLPTAPDVGLEVLIMRAQNQLDQVRTLTRELTADFHRGRAPQQPELVEVVTGAAAVQRRFEDLQRRAKREVQCLDTPPYAGEGGAPNIVELEALAHGVAYRGIYARAALEAGAGTIKAIGRYVAAGEQARLINSLPMKLATIDGELGFLPLETHQADISRFLLIRPCALLDTLLFVFETLWQMATPITFDRGVAVLHADREDGFTMLHRQILALLSAGMKDQAIAHHLGLSYSTTRRHITDLLARLGAETRFQAGMQAARLGLAMPHTGSQNDVSARNPRR